MSVFRKNPLYLLPILFFLVFYFYPLASIVQISFTQGETSSLFASLTAPRTLRIAWFTLWQAVVSTLLTLVIAIPSAYIFARYHWRGKRLFRTLITLPFVLPTVVVAAAFTALFGQYLRHTIWLILFAHVFYNVSVAIRLIAGYWESLPPHEIEAAAALGASPRHIFLTIIFPRLRPAIFASAVLIFIFTFTSFGVILILGGPRFATLEVEIYNQAAKIFNLPLAASLSLIQIGFTFCWMTLYTRSQAQLASTRSRAIPRPKPLVSVRAKAQFGVMTTVLLLMLGLPLFALILRSFSSGMTYYTSLFMLDRESVFAVRPISAVFNSLLTAFTTTLFAIILGLLAAKLIKTTDKERHTVSSFIDPLFMLPLATSAVTLGFGFIVGLNRGILDLRSSYIIIPIAHTLVAMPFVVRSLLPTLRALPASYDEAGQLLGADTRTRWLTLELPLIRRALTVGAVYAFTISMGEFGASVILVRDSRPTIPYAIFRLLGKPGQLNYGQALAMSVILLAVCACGFILLDRLGDLSESEF